MRRLGDIELLDLIPESIRHDPTIKAAAKSLDGLLRSTSLSVPNLLLWARLDPKTNKIAPPLARLRDAAGGFKPLSTPILELLAWGMHVDFRDVATDDRTLANFILDSIPWHRVKGTPAAVRRALAAYGIEAKVDECNKGRDWAVYELDLGDAPPLGLLPKIVEITNGSAPVRCRLSRLHDDYNYKPMIFDTVDRGWDVTFWDDQSGYLDPETGLIVSFQHKKYILGEEYLTKVGSASEMVVPILVLRDGDVRWDFAKWDGRYPEELLHRTARRLVQPILGEGVWLPGTAPCARRIARIASIAKSEQVWDSTNLDANLQLWDGYYYWAAKKAFGWDVDPWDADQDDYTPHKVPVYELFEEVRSFLNPQILTDEGRGAIEMTLAALVLRPGTPMWDFGRYDDAHVEVARRAVLAAKYIRGEGLYRGPRYWTGLWDDDTWAPPDYWPCRRRLARVAAIAKSEVVWDGTPWDADAQRLDGAKYTAAKKDFGWDVDPWDDNPDDYEIKDYPLYEIAGDSHGAICGPLVTGEPVSGVLVTKAARGTWPDIPTWDISRWDDAAPILAMTATAQARAALGQEDNPEGTLARVYTIAKSEQVHDRTALDANLQRWDGGPDGQCELQDAAKGSVADQLTGAPSSAIDGLSANPLGSLTSARRWRGPWRGRWGTPLITGAESTTQKTGE